MSEHTKGPWFARHRHVEAGLHDDEMSGLGWEIEPIEVPMRGMVSRAADAHLIAAAPDLLEALERLVYVTHEASIYGMWRGKPGANIDTTAQARHQAHAAISKAKGEEE